MRSLSSRVARLEKNQKNHAAFPCPKCKGAGRIVHDPWDGSPPPPGPVRGCEVCGKLLHVRYRRVLPTYPGWESHPAWNGNPPRTAVED